MSKQNSHKMGTFMATIVGMNAMIGAGIFMIPEQLQRSVGPAALLTYAFVIAAIWSIAYSLARVAAYYPQEGSFYTYITAWAGKRAGFIATSLYCIGLIFAMGLLTMMTGNYLHTFFPNISSKILMTIVLWGLAASIAAGARMLKWAQIILIALTIAPLLFLTILCLTRADFSNLTPFMPFGMNAVLKATKFVIFGFFGFEAVTTLYANVSRPEYTMPRAISWSIILVSLLYVSFIAATFLGLPRELFMEGKTFPEVLYAVFPNYPWLISIVLWGIIITIMGTIHALLWSVSSLMVSLSKMSGMKPPLTEKSAVGLLTLSVWLSSILVTNVELFFNITALCIILVLAGAIWPLAANIIKTTPKDRTIAIIGLCASLVMCGYALEGIVGYILS